METHVAGSTGGGYLSVRSSIVLGMVVLCISTVLFKSNAKARRQSELGACAPTLPSRFPFGFGVLAQIVGHLRTNTVLEWTQESLEVPGRTVEVRMVGLSMIMTDSIENIRAIMSTQFDCFGKGETYHRIWSSMMRDSILTTDGQAWQVNRSYLQPHTSKIRPTDYNVTERHARNLIQVLSDGKPHDTLDQLNRFAIDIVSDIFYGTSTNTLVTQDQSLRDAIQRHKNKNTWRTLFGQLGALIPPDREACDVINKYLDQVLVKFSLEDLDIEERNRKAETLLGVLSAQGVPDKELKDQLVAVLVGGRDSVAIAVTWALYELVRHPHVLAELREEISSTVGPSDVPSSTKLEEMTFLNAVVNETMRVHASVGINTRTALKDTSLPTGGGPNGTSPIGILAGTTIIMGLDSVHRRTDIFGPDSNIYNPHRWDNNWKPDTWTYYPFNRGAFQHIEMIEKCNEEIRVVNVEDKNIRTKMAFNTKPAEIIWLRFGK